MPPYPNKQKVLDLLPAGFSVNIDDFERVNAATLFLTCPNGHRSKYAESWNAIKKRISHGANSICFMCQGKTPMRPTAVVYNDLIQHCLLLGLIVDTPPAAFKGSKSRVDVRCFKRDHIQTGVLVESLHNRTRGCQECYYGHVKGAMAKCTCSGGCLTCQVRAGMKYIKHSISIQKYPGNVDHNWVIRQLKKQKGLCWYSDIKMDPTGKDRTRALSIDRHDNSKPHNQDNCVLVTLPVNLGKNRMNNKEFNDWLDNIFSTRGTSRDAITPAERNHIHRILNTGMRNNSNAARRARITCSVSFDELIEICNSQRQCAVTRCPVVWEPGHWNSGSFDRIDNSIGYTRDNIQVVLRNVNYMKNTILTTDECRTLIAALM